MPDQGEVGQLMQVDKSADQLGLILQRVSAISRSLRFSMPLQIEQVNRMLRPHGGNEMPPSVRRRPESVQGNQWPAGSVPRIMESFKAAFPQRRGLIHLRSYLLYRGNQSLLPFAPLVWQYVDHPWLADPDRVRTLGLRLRHRLCSFGSIAKNADLVLDPVGMVRDQTWITAFKFRKRL